MLDHHLNRIRLRFSLTIALLAVLMVAGLVVGQGLTPASRHPIARTLAQLRYRLAFAQIPAAPSPPPAAPASSTPAGAVPVLLYHRIVETPDDANVTLASFTEQLFTLKRAGWTTLTIQQFHDFLRRGQPVPDRSFLLTFDDGAKDSYYPVDPLLQALGYHAVSFVITGHSLGRRSGYYLVRNELEAMHQSGRWDLQAHARFGHDLRLPIDTAGNTGTFFGNRLWRVAEERLETIEEYQARVTDDLAGAKLDVARAFGGSVIGFAFPFGDYGQNAQQLPSPQPILLAAIREHYDLAFYQARTDAVPSANYPNPDELMVRRISVPPDLEAAELLARLEASRAKALPYHDELEHDAGWVKNWGRFTLDTGVLTGGATPQSTGGGVFLDGTAGWTNYAFSADVRELVGSSVSLVARFRNGDNFFACSFSDQQTAIEQRVGGWTPPPSKAS